MDICDHSSSGGSADGVGWDCDDSCRASGLALFRWDTWGSFIPCQVWTTGFFDKSVVGTANSLTAGLGNAGSGVTYFLMPAIFESFVNQQHLSHHVAWRVTFVIPFILITATAVVMIVTCPDTPTGSWSSRTRDVQRHLDMRDTFFSTKGNRKKGNALSIDSQNDTVKLNSRRDLSSSTEAPTREDDLLTAASWELVEKPTVQNSAKALSCLPTMTLVVAYFCSFGIELSVNSILGAFYDQQFPSLGQTGSGKYAAIFGVLNAVFRPIGGILSDTIYRFTGSLWGKKTLVHVLGILSGVFMIVIGLEDFTSHGQMIGLMTALAFFVESANGSCFSLVPHVHPASNGKLVLNCLDCGLKLLELKRFTGLITGVTGAAGDLGGIVFLLIARYSGTAFGRIFLLIGAVVIGCNILVTWIRPVPKGQLGGR